MTRSDGIAKPTNNLVIVSDLHCGCGLALCPPGKICLDDKGTYEASPIQLKLWTWWTAFWEEFVPHITRGESYDVAINGDLIDGVHHKSTTQISQNLTDQKNIAETVLLPVAERVHKKKGQLFVVRGTEAHGGNSGCDEEAIAKAIGAVPNEQGQYARWELRRRVGEGVVDCLHHIGTTGTAAYESTAVHKEMVEMFQESGRWGGEVSDFVVRSHRHRFIQTEIAGASAAGKPKTFYSLVTPGWQLKTPFAYRIPGGRQSRPQLGGLVIRQGDEELYFREKVWDLARPAVV